MCGGKDGIEVVPLRNSPMESNIYLVRGERNVLVDTGLGASVGALLKEMGRLRGRNGVDAIVLTHKHIDHTGGAAAFAEATGAPVYIHELEARAVKDGVGSETGAFMFGVCQSPVDVETLTEGDEVDLGGGEVLEVLHTPGHSEGSVCLWHPPSRTLLSGDTVFTNGGVGRWDLKGGDHTRLVRSLERLSKLDVVNIYPGHMAWSEGDGDGHIRMGLRSLSMF